MLEDDEDMRLSGHARNQRGSDGTVEGMKE
jgi:hypothetical protein